MLGYQTKSYKSEDPVNVEAAERMGKLHDQLKAIGYEGHALEVYLVRMLFCPNKFKAFLKDKHSTDACFIKGYILQTKVYKCHSIYVGST